MTQQEADAMPNDDVDLFIDLTAMFVKVKLPDGTVMANRINWDAYYDHAGKILFEHYNSQEQAEARGLVLGLGRRPEWGLERGQGRGLVR